MTDTPRKIVFGTVDKTENTESSDDTMDFVVGETSFIPVYESEIPVEVTNQILSKKELPVVNNLGSSMIEDFIVTKLKKGNTSANEIVEEFFAQGTPSSIQTYIEDVKKTSDNIEWEGVFNERDIAETQAAVLLEMRDLEMSDEQIRMVGEVKPMIKEGIGYSSYGENIAFVSRLQAVRRAVDYVTVFGESATTEDVLKTFLTSTIAHELGHKVDDVAGIATNNIQSEWKNGDRYVDSKNERFAEYWGLVPFKNDQKSKDILDNEWLLQLTKVQQVWEALQNYNSQYSQKIDLFSIFRGIEEGLDKRDDKDTLALLSARMVLYRAAPAENYASPYDRDTVKKALHMHIEK